ncbi:unnamed protein product, partial [Symbiodinium microadriaticum]
ASHRSSPSAASKMPSALAAVLLDISPKTCRFPWKPGSRAKQGISDILAKLRGASSQCWLTISHMWEGYYCCHCYFCDFEQIAEEGMNRPWRNEEASSIVGLGFSEASSNYNASDELVMPVPDEMKVEVVDAPEIVNWSPRVDSLDSRYLHWYCAWRLKEEPDLVFVSTSRLMFFNALGSEFHRSD